MGSNRGAESLTTNGRGEDAAVVESVDAPRRATLRTALDSLWNRFAESSLERVGALELAAQQAHDGAVDPLVRSQAERAAHQLAGTAQMFGVARGSELAREIEELLRGDLPICPADARLLLERTAALRGALLAVSLRSIGDGAPAIDPSPSLLIVEKNARLAGLIGALAHARGVRVASSTEAGAVAALQRDQPDVVLIDVAPEDDPEASYRVIRELAAHVSPARMIVVGPRDDFGVRLDVARLGPRTFLPRPLTPERAVDAALQILHQRKSEARKVLIVDDDPIILATLQALLGARGFALTTIADPRGFWDALRAVTPDLLILDLAMPHVDGVELCQVVRGDPEWSSLPIMFLTAHREPRQIQRLFDAGADDYVQKPIIAAELLARIAHRLDRSTVQRAITEIDPLTGIANRRRMNDVLQRGLTDAARARIPFCLAFVDLDGFKQINDRHGHPAGDLILREVGELLRARFRPTDVVGRWGGDEFVVGLPGARRAIAEGRMGELQEYLRRQSFIGPSGDRLRMSFSVGVAEFPTDGRDLEALYRVADSEMYRAKRGRGGDP